MKSDDVHELTRSISKTGGLGLASDEKLQWAQQLGDDDKVTLYCIFRDESQRHESEWRDEFIDRIRIQEELLPEPANESIDLQGFLSWAATHGNRSEVLDSFEEIIERCPDLEALRTQLTSVGQSDLLAMLDDYTSSE